MIPLPPLKLSHGGLLPNRALLYVAVVMAVALLSSFIHVVDEHARRGGSLHAQLAVAACGGFGDHLPDMGGRNPSSPAAGRQGLAAVSHASDGSGCAALQPSTGMTAGTLPAP